MEKQKVAQHVLMIGHIVIHGHDDGIRKILQGRYQFPVGAYVPVVVAYFEYRIALGKLQEFLRQPVGFELRKGEVEHKLVREHGAVQDGADGLGGIRYGGRKGCHGYDDLRLWGICLHSIPILFY